jgi:YbgC/YbaW family acyl-CoA thioester hydrolase
MPYEFKVERRVEFSETDMAGIVHYSNFFKYMETAEHAFYRSLGTSVVMKHVDPPLGWPRVRAECDYFKPLRFEDLVEVHMLVKEKKPKALTYVFRFYKLNGAREEVARGSLTVVCVTHENGAMRAVEMPADLASKIEVAPPSLLA